MHMALPSQSECWRTKVKCRTVVAVFTLASICMWWVCLCVCVRRNLTRISLRSRFDTIPSAKCVGICARPSARCSFGTHTTEISVSGFPVALIETSKEKTDNREPWARRPRLTIILSPHISRTLIHAEMSVEWLLVPRCECVAVGEFDWGGGTSHWMKMAIPLARTMSMLIVSHLFGICVRVWARNAFAVGHSPYFDFLIIKLPISINLMEWRERRSFWQHCSGLAMAPGTCTVRISECSYHHRRSKRQNQTFPFVI